MLTTALTSIDNQQPGSNGSVVFDVPFHSNASLQPRFITAVATDALGNSSEFSDCQSYDCDTIFKHSLDSVSAERCDEP